MCLVHLLERNITKKEQHGYRALTEVIYLDNAIYTTADKILNSLCLLRCTSALQSHKLLWLWIDVLDNLVYIASVMSRRCNHQNPPLFRGYTWLRNFFSFNIILVELFSMLITHYSALKAVTFSDKNNNHL